MAFTVGLPRAGKSSFSKKWRSENNGVVLSGDDFRMALYGKRFQIIGEEFVRAALITATRALLHQGTSVLFDETNTSLTSIRQILAIDPKAKVYLFTTSPEVCKNRAIACGHEDLLPSIDRMSKNLEVSIPYLREIGIEIEEVVYNAKPY